MSYGMLADGRWTDRRGVNILDTGAPFYDVYQTADGRHMAVGAIEPQFYLAFLTGLFAPDPVPAGLPDQLDQSGWPQLRRLFADRFALRSQQDWTAAFSGTDACVAPVRTMSEAPQDPQLAARGSYLTADGVLQPAPAPRFAPAPESAAAPGQPIPARPAGPITQPGADTREVLTGLGFTDVDDLLAAGAVQQA
jgi:alpha-methylacyl-CoA racemase